ncbi:hypothetical protein MMC17_000310 [Xylographa soralifera]|nr:hypothetical protein [Xylographa soralifera]
MGAGLGGGYGRYQGFYGLISDNIISANMVLADGSMVTVSETSNPDLYWGIRGAGHNFGIVTRFDMKIYDYPAAEWYFITLVFTQDKLEALVTQVNKMMGSGTQPKELMNYFVYAWNPEISTIDPVIILNINYVGTQAQAQQYVAPYLALNPAYTNDGMLPYPEIAGATGTGSNDFACQHGYNRIQYPVGLLTYNISTSRQVFELFKNQTLETPAFNLSTVAFEGYSLEAVKAVASDSTAFPHREDNILASILAVYAPDPALDAQAVAWGKQTRDMLHAGDEPGRMLNVYVNYAFGDETQEQIYGYEPWRLDKLRALKKEYDPHGRFNYYNPIIV